MSELERLREQLTATSQQFEEFKVESQEYEKVLEAESAAKDKEINQLKAKIDVLERKNEELKAEIRTTVMARDQLKVKLSEGEDASGELRKKVVVLEQANEDLESRVRMLEVDKEELQGRLASAEEMAIITKDELNEIIDSKQDELIQLRQELRDSSDEVAALKANLSKRRESRRLSMLKSIELQSQLEQPRPKIIEPVAVAEEETKESPALVPAPAPALAPVPALETAPASGPELAPAPAMRKSARLLHFPSIEEGHVEEDESPVLKARRPRSLSPKPEEKPLDESLPARGGSAPHKKSSPPRERMSSPRAPLQPFETHNFPLRPCLLLRGRGLLRSTFSVDIERKEVRTTVRSHGEGKMTRAFRFERIFSNFEKEVRGWASASCCAFGGGSLIVGLGTKGTKKGKFAVDILRSYLAVLGCRIEVSSSSPHNTTAGTITSRLDMRHPTGVPKHAT
eukprot:TRINITY_DN4942_c0_g1_i11.p1 TRINITY_DN4942_c0_g1~~TRINITY_DN4942_c0_g1_i11.p1  ORF type:complete len:456 (+),score=117.68 TRINITY_DN4942_c0_g1_i11:359-1726(+)